MVKKFEKIKAEIIKENIFELIGNEWMLITAGTQKIFNTMTASWGGFGILWGKKICFCVIRPTRYTYRFMEESEYFTLCFFEKKYKKILTYCGSNSGKDVDKVSRTGLTPVDGKNDTVYFNEARLVIMCRKIYFQDIAPKNFLASGSLTLRQPSFPLYHSLYL